MEVTIDMNLFLSQKQEYKNVAMGIAQGEAVDGTQSKKL